MSGDFLEINIEINGDFAVRVLQDSLEKRLNEAFETAGLDMSTESLLASGQDMSPEAVSGRIVDFAVSFLAHRYERVHGETRGFAPARGTARLRGL